MARKIRLVKKNGKRKPTGLKLTIRRKKPVRRRAKLRNIA